MYMGMTILWINDENEDNWEMYSISEEQNVMIFS